MLVETEDLVSATDISMIIGITPSAVSNWLKRHEGTFPEPVTTVSNGRTRLYLLPDVVKWWKEHRQLPPTAHAKRERFNELLNEGS